MLHPLERHTMGHPVPEHILPYFGFIMLAAVAAMAVTRFKQPPVLGQILIGSLIAILAHFKLPFFTSVVHNDTIAFMAELGSIFLLFEIGLESDIGEISHAGAHAILVALTGIIIPFISGFYVLAPLIKPDHDLNFSLFIASTLAVTSTGISVSAFKAMGIIKHRASQIVLAASIIDDIAGLILLSVITGLVSVGYIDTFKISLTLIYIFLFFVLSVVFTRKLLPKLIDEFLVKISLSQDMLLLSLVVICIIFALCAELIGLATIIGAFFAGLLIEEKLFAKFQAKQNLAELISPIGKVLTPVFFIYAGMQVDIIAALNFNTIKLAVLISVFAIASKAVCGIFLPKQINKWIVGFGMVPRGEIGIIFALAGLEFQLIDNEMFTALLLMVVVTSIVAPIMINKIAARDVVAEKS